MDRRDHAEAYISSWIADELMSRRHAAYKVWRKHKDQLGNGNDYLRDKMGTIRTVAGELVEENPWTGLELEPEITAELRRLAGLE